MVPRRCHGPGHPEISHLHKTQTILSYTDIIHRWIQAPSEIKEADYHLLKAFKKQYPYFHPLYYLDQFLAAGKAARRSRPVLLYPVNPVLLAAWTASAGGVRLPRTAPGLEGLAAERDPVADAAAKPADQAVAGLPESSGKSSPDTDDILSVSNGSARRAEGRPADPDNTSEKQGEPGVGQGLPGGDYFATQGIQVDDTLPEEVRASKKTEKSAGAKQSGEDAPMISREKDLMVVMSFAEWLNYLENRSQKAKEEEASQRAFKARWQQQKLAEALEEETDEIPETVFEMAVSSISRDEEPVSETLAEVYIRQGKKAKAIELFEKLSLQNPEKNAYFAQKIARLKKEIDI